MSSSSTNSAAIATQMRMRAAVDARRKPPSPSWRDCTDEGEEMEEIYLRRKWGEASERERRNLRWIRRHTTLYTHTSSGCRVRRPRGSASFATFPLRGARRGKRGARESPGGGGATAATSQS